MKVRIGQHRLLRDETGVGHSKGPLLSQGPVGRPGPRPFAAMLPALSLFVGTEVSNRVPPKTVDDAPEPLEWGFDGCLEVRPGPVCTLEPDTRLRVWASETDGPLRPPRSEGLVLEAEETVDGGKKWAFVLRRETAELDLRGLVDRPRRSTTLKVRTATGRTCPLEIPNLENAREQEVREFEAELAAQSQAFQAECWRAAGLALRTVPRLATTALNWLEAAENRFADRGERLGQMRTAAARAFLLLQQNRPDESTRVLKPLAFSPHLSPGLRLPLLNTYGYASYDLGDLGAAQEALSLAARWSRRLGNTKQWMWAARSLLSVHERLGRYSKAQSLAAQIVARSSDMKGPCQAQAALAAVHWWSLIRRTRPFVALDAPIPFEIDGIDLGRLRREMNQHVEACPVLRTEVASNLALESLLLKDLEDARHHLERAQAWFQSSGGIPRNEPWLAEARIAWELEMHRPRAALTRIATLETQGVVGPALAWALETRRADAYRQLHAVPEARAAWQRAAALLERWPGAVTLDRALNGLSSRLYRAAQEQVGFLASKRRVQEAVDVARWARARALHASRSVDRLHGLDPSARRQWELRIGLYRRLRAALEALPRPRSDLEAGRIARVRERLGGAAEEALRDARRILWTRAPLRRYAPPGPGETFLVIHPGRGSWLLLAIDAHDARVVRAGSLELGAAELEASLTRALGRIDTLLARSRQLRLMAVGTADRVDVHRLRWRGQPLFQARPVLFGLDVGGSEPGAPPLPADRTPTALLVANPEGEDRLRRLPHAAQEAKSAERALASRGWRVNTRQGAGAEREQILALLDGVDLFHFAGHATQTASRFGSGLRVRGGKRLAMRDILALRQAPRIVILTACGSGVENEREAAGLDLGPAQAFVLAGASLVVATTRPVEDRLAARLGRGLHARGAYTPLEAARVLGELARREPGDWAAFRVFVP